MTIRWLHGRAPTKPVAHRGLGATLVILAAVLGSLCADRVLAAGFHPPGADPAPAAARVSTSASSSAPGHRSADRPAANRAPQAKFPANNGYVGSGACSRCHADIYNHFARTSMGQSMRPVTPEFLSAIPLPAHVYDHKLDRHFEARSEGGKLYQSEYQLDDQGKEVFRNTHAVEWIVGADANGLGALIQQKDAARGDYIFEAPLSYYKQTRSWELSPGYQRGDYGFNRAVVPGCINCHSGRPQPVSASEGRYQDPAFTQLAIGCENCHGPGEAHVRSMGEGESYAKGKDPNIVNPQHLAGRLADDICMSCHQTGDTRVFQPGKTYQDFRPGQPLNRIMAILMVPPTRDNPPREDHVEHYYSMTMSQCYRSSVARPGSQQMRCITCHDPHIEPTAAEAPAYFNGKCMQCHTAASCKEEPQTRAQTAPVRDNCIGCHMQKRDGIAISHTSITNHRIVRRPDEPFPDAAFDQATAALPDLIYLNSAPGGLNEGPGGLNRSPAGRAVSSQAFLPQVTLLQAYGQLKEQFPAYAARYQQTLGALERSDPQNAIVQGALGHQALAAGRLDEARQHLTDSVNLDPAQPAVFSDLATVAEQKGEAAESLAMARKAVTLDPYNAPRRKALVLSLINAKAYTEAETAMEKYLEDFPEDDFMRKMLAIAKAP